MSDVAQRLIAEIQDAVGIGELTFRSVDDVMDRFGARQSLATRDAVRSFCLGTGNFHPRYIGSKDKESTHVPPHFLHAIAFQGGLEKRPIQGISGGLYGGNEVVWYRDIEIGEEILVESIAGRVRDISRSGALQFLWPLETIYRDLNNETIAVFTSTTIFFGSEKRRLRPPPPQRRFSSAEIGEWFELMEREPLHQGCRYWEDVEVGDTLPTTHQVFTPAQSVAFFSGCNWFEDWRVRMKEQASRPGIFNWQAAPESGIPELDDPWWHIFHDDAERADMGRVFCPGRLMECWLGNHITNWMGAGGFLSRLKTEYRALLFADALVTCQGCVTGKSVSGNQHRINLEVTLMDHQGVAAVPAATAEIFLPSKQTQAEQ